MEENMPQRIKKLAFSLLLVAVILPLNLAGCTQKTANPLAGGDTLVQISTIDAVLNGLYDGVKDFKTLRTYGDFGIGTFQALDGEMIEVDGKFYQVKADGKVYPVDDGMLTPFASVTYFSPDSSLSLTEGMNYTQLQAFLDKNLPTDNIFYAIKIKGTFSYMKTRSVPAQQKPYPPLVEVTAHQPVFEMTDVEGVIVGFRSPSYVSGVNVPGYHLHFLTADKTAGGHILDFTVKNATAHIDNTSDFLMILPGETSDFYKLDLSQDKEAELNQAEK
jgi:acetolactate decarboxylase